ncbi:hypothetical protein HanRHA438_Chr02g0055481 [Helianthus annuus]|nr:hypothetical protein HanRHA438_Chr02g0055481 [Helianthus annuus]
MNKMVRYNKKKLSKKQVKWVNCPNCIIKAYILKYSCGFRNGLCLINRLIVISIT